MQASELYQIVKDVPRDAWPTELAWDGQGWIGTQYDEYIGDATAEAAFVGSMTAWRSAKRTVAVCGTTVKVGSSLTPLREWDEYRASSLVAALAAACKEVGT
jgi:hypothetical protein